VRTSARRHEKISCSARATKGTELLGQWLGTETTTGAASLGTQLALAVTHQELTMDERVVDRARPRRDDAEGRRQLSCQADSRPLKASHAELVEADGITPVRYRPRELYTAYRDVP
jgi:hypothetical protein